jgi:release factor glutamine methyltransferase
MLSHLLGLDRGGLSSGRRKPSRRGRGSGSPRWWATREAGPLQYLIREQEFRGLVLRVDRRVLVPRPETEELVQAALDAGPPRAGRVLDLGTGSGCIAISIAVERPDLEVVAVDRSEKALELARTNAERNRAGHVTFVHRDFRDLPASWAASFDLVVSNPPYVSEEEWASLAPEVRDHEPREALVPGATGLEGYLSLAPSAHGALRAGGTLLVELGYRSETGARAAVIGAGFGEIVVANDLRGIPRILRARKAGS